MHIPGPKGIWGRVGDGTDCRPTTRVRTFATSQRLEKVPPGRLAWLYLRPHETPWDAALERAA